MDECIDSLGSDAVFSTVDANREYWQVKIENEDWYKTVISSYHGIYRFELMPFELQNASSTF